MIIPEYKLEDFQEIIDLLEMDVDNKLHTAYINHDGIPRLFLRGATVSTEYENELMLRLNYIKKELVVARIGFVNQRVGHGTRLLNILTKFAKENGYEKIILEAVSTEKMSSFAKKHGFKVFIDYPYQSFWEKSLI